MILWGQFICIFVLLITTCSWANDRTDFRTVNQATWQKSFDSWGGRAGYWGSIFVPMRALHDLDNKMLRMTGSSFTIEELMAPSKGPLNGEIRYESNSGYSDGPQKKVSGTGVTFQQYNKKYKADAAAEPMPEKRNEEKSDVFTPLSDLIVPAARRW